MALYPYQKRVDQLLRAGRSVILQAPTGAGKTRSALFPFLDGWRNVSEAFPRQCIYAVPMRVLANQFEVEYRQTVATFSTRFGFLKDVRIQTGARPDDRRFEGDLIFTTIDQALSSFLTIPYSLGNRLANLNAGAVIGSYLIFDEFHLFPVDDSGDGALGTTLQMLQMLKGVVPFVLMTATFSSTMIARLAELLDAEAVTLTREDVAELPSQQGKRRGYRWCATPLNAEAIVSDLLAHERRRVIAICNTVDRAQTLADELRRDPRMAGVAVGLLHSRFYTCDRDDKEKQIRQEFGEDRAGQTDRPMVLVATQVVEVGLNITCAALHTELAPAAALVQRAGRCARFAHETGDVFIYELPTEEKGEPSYAPYHEDGQRLICERTRAALQEQLPPGGRVLSYHDELALVDAAHTPADEQLLTTLHERRHALGDAVAEALRTQQRSLARRLIRDIDSRTVIVHPDPTDVSLPNPYRYQGIGLRPGQLARWYVEVSQYAWDQGLDWIAKIAQVEEASQGAEGAERGRTITTSWKQVLRPVADQNARKAEGRAFYSAGSIIALNPALVQYSTDLGLLLLPGEHPATESPPAPRKSRDASYGPITHESYAEHIRGLYRFYVQHQRDRTAAARRRLEQRFGLSAGALDRAIRLMFAIHDLGKLDHTWQRWAHSWQARVAQLRKRSDCYPFTPGYMAAHTDYDSQDTLERAAQNTIRPPRPNHAAESARAGRDLVAAVAEGNDSLHTAIISAIICHHSAHLRTDHGTFTPAEGAKPAFYNAMHEVQLFDDAALRASGARVAWAGFKAADSLSEDIIRANNIADVLLYLFLVRILRLADQGSQSLE